MAFISDKFKTGYFKGIMNLNGKYALKYFVENLS